MRSLTAEALLWAYPRGPLFAVSLGVMAVANAFVMLGLLPKPLAEAILAEHRSELERQGFGDSWGGHQGRVNGPAGRPWVLAVPDRGPARLREVPVLVAAAGGMPGDWSGSPANEGTGSFFWPPVPTARKRIRVTVSTLWEAAWADIELPR